MTIYDKDQIKDLLASHRFRAVIDARYSSWEEDDMRRVFHPSDITHVLDDGPGHPEFWCFGSDDLPKRFYQAFHMFVIDGVSSAEVRGDHLYLDVSRLDWPRNI